MVKFPDQIEEEDEYEDNDDSTTDPSAGHDGDDDSHDDGGARNSLWLRCLRKRNKSMHTIPSIP